MNVLNEVQQMTCVAKVAKRGHILIPEWGNGQKTTESYTE
jgi:hypothetical protein